MKTVKIDIEHARKSEQTLSAAFRVLTKAYKETEDSDVLESLLEIMRVRRDLDFKIFQTQMEEIS